MDPTLQQSAQHGTDDIIPCGLCQMRGHGVCGVVSAAELKGLASLATIIEVQRGTTFVWEGHAAEHLYVILFGSAKLYMSLPDGRRHTVGFVYSGSLIGLSPAAQYCSSVEALTAVRVCRLPRKGLGTTLCCSSQIEKRLLDIALDGLTRAQAQILLLGRKTSLERTASFLVLHASYPQPGVVKPPRIHLPMSRGDIADYLGMAAETFSRTLTKLRSIGLIRIPNVSEIIILDWPRLESLANATAASKAASARI